MISNITIENTADIGYKDIKIKLNYYSTSYRSVGQQVNSATAVLPITIPTHSKGTYLKGGMPIGMGAQSYQTKYVQVLGGRPCRKGFCGKFWQNQEAHIESTMGIVSKITT